LFVCYIFFFILSTELAYALTKTFVNFVLWLSSMWHNCVYNRTEFTPWLLRK